ncbi:MAG: SPOR domain-containing protein [Parahaliea sp.]
MKEVLKQRLVGALILVALGVVFWPIIFVEPEQRAPAPVVNIPPPPAIDTATLAAPDRGGLRASPPAEPEPDNPARALTVDEAGDNPAGPAATVDPAPLAREENDEIAARARQQRPAQPRTDAQGIPIAWTLQVVSVSKKQSAEGIARRLVAMGHKADVKVAEVEGRKVYRVYVGPKFERARLEAIKPEIDRELGVQSMLRRYYP